VSSTTKRVRGTPISAPTVPQTQPQNTTEKRTTTGESARYFPCTSGSIQLPMISCTPPPTAKAASGRPGSPPLWTKA